MHSVLLLLEESDERLQNTLLAQLERSSNPSKHRHKCWPTLFLQVHRIVLSRMLIQL